MSHVATITLEFRDPAALGGGPRLSSRSPRGNGRVLRRDARGRYGRSGCRWRYPVVIDTDGRLHYDHFEGRWGDLAQLHRFRQAYAETATRRFAQARGYLVTRTAQADGTVRLALSR